MRVPQHRKTSITAGIYIHLLGNVIKRVNVNDGIKDCIITQQPPAGNIVMKHNPALRTCSQIYGNLMLGHSIHELRFGKFIIPTHIWLCKLLTDTWSVRCYTRRGGKQLSQRKEQRCKKAENKPTLKHIKKLGNNIINQ